MTNVSTLNTTRADATHESNASGGARIRKSGLGAIVARALLPIALIGAGFGAYTYLAIPTEQAKTPPAEKQDIRTNVQRLAVADYQIMIQTNGIVQAHNEVAFSAEVGGQVTSINPLFEVGSTFKEGDILVEIESSDYQTALAIAEAQLESARSSLELATLVLERNEKLFAKNSTSEAEVNQAAAAKKQAAAELDSAAAQVAQAKRDLARTKFVAPFDGRVRMKSVGIGQSVAPGTPIGTVFAIDYAEVRLPIAVRERKFLKLPELPGDPAVDVELRDAIDESSTNVWNARIVRTEGTLDSDSLELYAIARIDDPFGRESGLPALRPGQPVTASIEGATLTDAVALPRTAVRQLDQVFLVDKTKLTLAERTISPVWSDEDFVIVQDPLIHDGALLATTQLVYAPTGAKVEIIPDIDSTTAEAKTTKTDSKAAAN